MEEARGDAGLTTTRRGFVAGAAWAGTEVATYWSGYMDGAVRSGEVAACQVLRALR